MRQRKKIQNYNRLIMGLQSGTNRRSCTQSSSAQHLPVILSKLNTIQQNKDQTQQLQMPSNTLFLLIMQESPVRVDKKLIKVTAIPVQIFDDPTQLAGLVRFSTQSSAKPLPSLSVTTRRKKNIILYRNQIESQEEQPHQRRGKEIQLYETILISQKYKNKRFKVEIPIVKGYKSSRQQRGNELHFTFSFSNTEGVLALLNGQYEAKSEFTGRECTKETDRDKLQRQLAKLDNRKREELNMDLH